jgi:hypothetical protein
MMSDDVNDTLYSRPLPKRPQYGLLAWQATIGYISTEYSPDAMLTFRAYMSKGHIAWGAAVSWGQVAEQVNNLPTLERALQELWHAVESGHIVFKTKEVMVKRPINYADDEWIDLSTQMTVERLLEVTRIAFGQDWMLMVFYQALDNPQLRVQARLLAKENSLQMSGRGPAVREACHDLYHNAAPGIFAISGRQPLGRNF